MMQTILRQPVDAMALARQGFLRKDLLNAAQVSSLLQLYAQYFPGGTDKFFSSTFIADVTLKEDISRQLCDILLPAASPYFENYKVLGAQFLVKNPGNGGKMPYHQDWTIVDEHRSRSITVWIGLDDINDKNGAIKAVPGSHEFSRDLRGPGNYDALADLQGLLGEYAHTLSMRGRSFYF